MKNGLLVFVLFLAACGGSANNQNTAAITPQPNAAATPAAKIAPDAELEKQFADIAKEAKGKVGVAAFVYETGQNASLNGTEHFPMQSVYKVPIALTMLKQVEDGKLSMQQNVEITKDDMVREGQASPIRDANPNGTTMPLWWMHSPKRSGKRVSTSG